MLATIIVSIVILLVVRVLYDYVLAGSWAVRKVSKMLPSKGVDTKPYSLQ